MALSATIAQAGKLVAAVGLIGGGALTLDSRHASQAEFTSYKAAGKVSTILELVDRARRDGPAGWLCRAINEEFIALCTDMPDHYLCNPEAKKDLEEKAGCE